MSSKISPLVAQKDYKKELTVCKYLRCEKKVVSEASFATDHQNLDFQLCKDHRDWISFKMDMIKCLVENEKDWKLFIQEIRDFCGIPTKSTTEYYYRYNGRDYKVSNADELVYLWFQIGRIQFREMTKVKAPYGEYMVDKYTATPDAIKKCVYYKNTWQAKDGHIYNLMIGAIQNDLIDALKTRLVQRITKEQADLEE